MVNKTKTEPITSKVQTPWTRLKANKSYVIFRSFHLLSLYSTIHFLCVFVYLFVRMCVPAHIEQ